MLEVTFPDVESVCYNIQNFIYSTRYNLKRTTNDVNPKRLTFVCSCICKKTIKDDDSYTNSETLINTDKKRSNHLSGFVKRRNEKSCPYRLTFLKQESSGYTLKNKLNNKHNHPPEDDQKVSLLYFFLNYLLYHLF